MDDLLRYETQVQALVQESSSSGVFPFPSDLKSGSPEAELWSRVHLGYVTSLNSGGHITAAAIEQWASIRSGSLFQYVPKRTWSLPQAELNGLEQKLTMDMQNCKYEFDFPLNDGDEVVTPLTLFSYALLCCACKDKELFDENLLPNEVTWSELVHRTYSPTWKAGIEFVCTHITNENLLPMAFHVLSEIVMMHSHFAKLSSNQVTAQKDCLSWLYEPQQLKTIISCCEDAILSYFDTISKLQLCEDLNQMLSTETVSSVTRQVNDCVHGAKVVIQSCWRLCDDIDHVVLILNGRCPLMVRLQPLCADAIVHATDTCFQKLSEWSSSDAPQRLPYHSWYIVLSSLLHMAGRLHHHVTHNGVNCLATPVERCSKLVDRIQSDIVGYHIELCNNGLLHDGRSHHWQDSRPFHEGERCSFAVQMWAYHLKAFKHDLWRVFASDVAAKLLAAVLAEGLVTLSQRYTSVKPSMRRLPQMKADILMILLTSASWLPHLFPLPCLHDHHLYVTSCVINSCCMSLLCDLILVCADLRSVMDAVMENTVTTNGLRRGFSDCNPQWLVHVLLHCHVDLPPTYTMGMRSSAADAGNSLLYLCGLSTMNEQLLIKVLVVNDFLFSKGLIRGGAGVVGQLAHVLCQCSHASNGLCVVLEEAGSKECTDWLVSYLQPHLLWCMLPKAVLFTRWMVKFMHDEVTANDSNKKALVEIFSGVLKQILGLLHLLPNPVCLLMSRLSPVSTLLGRLLRLMFPQSHNQLFYNFVNVVAGILDSSMLFEAPASVMDLLSLCKSDFTPFITAINDTCPSTGGIYFDNESEHKIVAKLLRKTRKGRACLRNLFDTIVSNQDVLLQWCKIGVDCEQLTLTAPPTHAETQPFCPTKEFHQIGQVTLDHAGLLKASLDWAELLSAIWPQMSEEMLTNHFDNRWEFQEEAWLNDEECQLVDALKKRLGRTT